MPVVLNLAPSAMAGLLLLASWCGPAHAQWGAPPTLRGGLLVVHGASLGFDLDVPLMDRLSGLGIVRGVDEGLDCLGAARVSPCTADGVSLGVGLRMQSEPHGWGIYAEGFGGGHRYRSGDIHPMVGGGLGVMHSVGARGSVELGYELRRIGADQLETLTYTGVGSTHRNTHGVRFSIGFRLR